MFVNQIETHRFLEEMAKYFESPQHEDLESSFAVGEVAPAVGPKRRQEAVVILSPYRSAEKRNNQGERRAPPPDPRTQSIDESPYRRWPGYAEERHSRRTRRDKERRRSKSRSRKSAAVEMIDVNGHISPQKHGGLLGNLKIRGVDTTLPVDSYRDDRTPKYVPRKARHSSRAKSSR